MRSHISPALAALRTITRPRRADEFTTASFAPHVLEWPTLAPGPITKLLHEHHFIRTREAHGRFPKDGPEGHRIAFNEAWGGYPEKLLAIVTQPQNASELRAWAWFFANNLVIPILPLAQLWPMDGRTNLVLHDKVCRALQDVEAPLRWRDPRHFSDWIFSKPKITAEIEIVVREWAEYHGLDADEFLNAIKTNPSKAHRMFVGVNLNRAHGGNKRKILLCKNHGLSAAQRNHYKKIQTQIANELRAKLHPDGAYSFPEESSGEFLSR